MNFKDSAKNAIEEVNSLNELIDNIKNYRFIGNLILYFLSSFIFPIALNEPFSFDLFIISFIFAFAPFFLVLMILMLLKNNVIIKELDLHIWSAEYVMFPVFYNRKQKKEIREKYDNLNKDIKCSLVKTSKIHQEIKTHLFLEYFILNYIEKNHILNEYKDILQFVSETEYNIDKKNLFNNVLDKLIQENSFFYKKYKDELVDYIYNSNLKDKKLILSLIKEHIQNNSDVDYLYNDINNIKIKKEEQNSIVISL